MAGPTTLDEAYERLGFAPLLDFEVKAMERNKEELERRGQHGPRRIGTTTQVLVECLIDIIAYEASPAYPQAIFNDPGRPPTRREDDFVLVMGPGFYEQNKSDHNQLAGEFYKRLGGRHSARPDGPPNLWIIPWEGKSRVLRSTTLSNERFFFDPWSAIDSVVKGPMRLIREIPPKPVMKAADGSWVYEALDRSGRRIALVTTQQAQSLAQWSLRPIRIGGDWFRPQGTYP